MSSTTRRTTAARSSAGSKSAASNGRARGARREPVRVEDLREYVFLGDPRTSPDGERVLFVHKRVGEKNRYERNLWTAPVGAGEPRPFTQGGHDSQGRWSPDGSRIAFVRGGKDEPPQVHVIGVDGGEARCLTKFPEGSISALEWSPDGTALACTFRPTDPAWTKQAKKAREEAGLSDPPRVLENLWYRLDGDGYFGSQRATLHVVDAATGEHREVFARDTLGLFSWDWAADSKSIVVAANTHAKALVEPWRTALHRVDVKTGRAKRIPNLPDGPKDRVRVSPDGSRLAWAGREGRDDAYSTENLRLFVCDADGSNARDLFTACDFCLLAATLGDTSEASFDPEIEWHPDGRRIFVRVGWHGAGRLASVDVESGAITFHTDERHDVHLGTFSGDGGVLSLTRGTFTAPPEIAVAKLARRIEVRPLTDFNGPHLATRTIAEVEERWVESTDGVKVHVWTMRPPGVARSKRVPTILQIHGGPHAQYGATFFHEFQVLASAGYAIVFSNPRGSKGYGRDHCHAIRGAWGGKDWEDIQAVTRWMKEQPWVDAGRLGVMGGSYGGYMTNWVIGHTDEFKAAITDRCVSNLVSMAGSSDFPNVPDRYWPGNAWDRPEALWEQSPLKHLGNATTPTLVIHSEGDLRCNVEQAEQVFTCLQLNGVESKFVRYPASTSHGLSRSGPPDLREHRLRQILDWWRSHLGPRG